MYKPELLAPAGDLDRLKVAIDYGADAVYIGGSNYSLRANANNFNNDELKEAIEYAHKYNKKVYVTVNMVFHEDDLKDVKEYLLYLDEINVDGLIVSDMAIIKYIRLLNINKDIILSTQASSCNKEALKFYSSLNIKRVVLARECSKEDIKDMIENSNIELEVFIHGAMCTSYSGACVMSNYVTLRDSNRGGCSQVCRFTFDALGYDKEFQMCSKDLNMIDNIEELMNMKISSFKIEGRMKSMYYIASVVDAYRKIIDGIYNKSITFEKIAYYKKVLAACANRENKSQFFNEKTTYKDQYFLGRNEVSNQDFIALVLDYDPINKEAIVEQRNHFKINDELEVFGPSTDIYKFKISSIKNSKNESVLNAPHPQEILRINMDKRVNKGDIIRRIIT